MKRIYKDEENADHSAIHLMINSQCTNVCSDCCNNQYDLDSVPVVTLDELKAAKEVMLTGGEPFLIPNILSVVESLRKQFPNIERLYIYTSGFAMFRSRSSWARPRIMLYVDGINFSPKSEADRRTIVELFQNTYYRNLMGYMKSTRFILMNFPDRKKSSDEWFIRDLHLGELENTPKYTCKFTVEHRDFQEEFQPSGGIWRRFPVFLDYNHS